MDIGSYIMHAAEIQIWGGSSEKNLILLKKLNPKQPEKWALRGIGSGSIVLFSLAN